LIKIKAEQLEKSEPYYFWFLLALHLVPVFSVRFFPTVDGPAHLYNSRLIVDLLHDPGSPLSSFFSFNTTINPNWSGHFLQSAFLVFLPAFAAEKLVLLIYLIGFPAGFRFLFKTLGIKNKLIVYMIFPFTYSFLFYYGFYNFHIGLVVFLFAIGLWIKYDYHFTTGRILKLLALATLICLSHVFIFISFLLFLFIMNVAGLNYAGKENRISKITFKSSWTQLLIVAPGLLLTGYYFLSGPSIATAAGYLPIEQRISLITQVQPAKGIVLAGIFSRWIFFAIVALLLSVFSARLFRKKIPEQKGWLWLTGALLVLYFVLPDSISSFGFLSSRLLLLFFIFIIAWLGLQKFPVWLNVLVFVLMNYVSLALLLMHYRVAKASDIYARETVMASARIEPYSIVLPVQNRNYFLYAHLSNYLGAEKPMVILENYEAGLNYFPLKWNRDQLPDLRLGHVPADSSCIQWPSNPKQPPRPIDYVFIIPGESSPAGKACEENFRTMVESSYELVYEGPESKIKLYKYRK
jgi:hypothetical protein